MSPDNLHCATRNAEGVWAWKGRGDPDHGFRDAAAAASGRPAYRSALDDIFLPGAYTSLGALYEAKGNSSKAAEYYQKFVDLWKNADAELQPQVSEVRQRLAKLRARP